MPTASSPSLQDSTQSERAKYVVGVCAMDRKARSKPMRHILNRLLAHGDFEIVIFGDKTIIDEEVENWPGCDFLICFFSGGFPMEKAQQYTKLRKPFVVNNVHMQTLLWDRRVVLSILDSIGVPTPPRLVVSRDGGAKIINEDAKAAFKECSGMDLDRVLGRYACNSKNININVKDGIEVDHAYLEKTFIEKPANGEDHNINIYYSEKKGGGGRRLFRKIGNKSSEFDPDLNTPSSEGSWIYEKLMETENCEDIKLYTVGPTFVYAETRKSPTVDGHVKRNTDGKEIRYRAKLTQEEEDIARKVSKVFGQQVCGLDILRVQGKSYVIDVNGWSFVKGNDFYYDQCAKLMKEAFYRSVQERPLSMADQIPPEISPQNSWRLKGFVAVFRHADRTPKEKLKITLMEAPFEKLLQGSRREVVFRQKHQLEMVLQATQDCLESQSENEPKLRSLKEILEKKLQLDGTKVQLKPKFDNDTNQLVKLQIIVKWGGEFTHAGRHQSRDLAENLRKDMNILNRQVLDDVKIFSSSERRVRDTAQVFARWFLGDPESMEGVISESKYLLDDSNAAKDQADAVKRQLKGLLRPGNDIQEWMLAQMAWPANLPQPYVILQDIASIMGRMQRVMRENWVVMDVDSIQRRWCCFESPHLFRERWEKMFRNFVSTTDEESDEAEVRRSMHPESYPDPSWIPALYDSLKYDALHNRQFLQTIFSNEEDEVSVRTSSDASTPVLGRCGSDLRELYRKVKIMFDFIATQEFGISDTEKKNIGMLISFPLLKSILSDLDEMKSADNARTRLYFTKESHVHALLNLVYLSGVPTKVPRNTLPELDFLTQITFELYERNRHSVAEKEYSLRIGFSSGAHYDSVLDLKMDAEHCLKVAPRRNLIPHLLMEEVLTYHKGYLNVPNLKSIEEQIEERKLYYAQEDNQ